MKFTYLIIDRTGDEVTAISSVDIMHRLDASLRRKLQEAGIAIELSLEPGTGLAKPGRELRGQFVPYLATIFIFIMPIARTLLGRERLDDVVLKVLRHEAAHALGLPHEQMHGIENL